MTEYMHICICMASKVFPAAASHTLSTTNGTTHSKPRLSRGFGLVPVAIICIVLGLSLIDIVYQQDFISIRKLGFVSTSVQYFSQDEWAKAIAGFMQRGTKQTPPFPFKTSPTATEAFRDKLLYVRDIHDPAPPSLHTRFDKNDNIHGYGLSSASEICMLPDGPLLLVGISMEEFRQALDQSPALQSIFDISYNCTSGCPGYRLVDRTPAGATWVKGNSTHIIPYLGNVFHNFADRVWPHIAGFQHPLNTTTPKPINHFVVQDVTTRLQQSRGSTERSTLLFQIWLLGLLSPGADFLAMDGQASAVCYEKLVLDCERCDRVSDILGDLFRPALLRYREAAFSYMGLREPQLSLPPRPLRVTYYGRNDTRRRRVINSLQVVEHLRAWKQPPLDVLHLDALQATFQFNQTFPETLSLMMQTDIFITVHGANTWAAIFLPEGAAVVEIYGPCGPSSWLKDIAKALRFKHSYELNPWQERVPSPFAGNTTECVNFYQTPDFTLDMDKLDFAIKQLAIPTRPSDAFPLHWLYNWTTHSYT